MFGTMSRAETEFSAAMMAVYFLTYHLLVTVVSVSVVTLVVWPPPVSLRAIYRGRSLGQLSPIITSLCISCNQYHLSYVHLRDGRKNPSNVSLGVGDIPHHQQHDFERAIRARFNWLLHFLYTKNWWGFFLAHLKTCSAINQFLRP